jgi:ubiquinone/menaquinone biosynthesis C-methylase UbiE
VTLGQRFARLATDVAVRRPMLWPLFRPFLRRVFDRMAPDWAEARSADAFEPLAAALAGVAEPPHKALDLGTGTGQAAFVVAERFRDAEVVGVDLSPEMLAQARSLTPPALADRLRFDLADGARLPYADGEFDLVTLANMIPFFDEVARVLRPGGWAVFAFSLGPQTPIYVAPERLRAELGGRGFEGFEELAAGPGTAFVARKR